MKARQLKERQERCNQRPPRCDFRQNLRQCHAGRCCHNLLEKKCHHLLDRKFLAIDLNQRPLLGSLEKDRKSTRLNSSHQIISYAVFCLKKKTNASTRKTAQTA